MPAWLDKIGAGFSALGRGLDRGQNEFRQVDPTGRLAGAAGAAGRFGQLGLQGYQDRTAMLGDVTGQLQRQMRGEDSYARELLQQQQQGLVGQQASMAAGARGGNQAMAARQAMTGAGNIGVGMAGQGALADIRERQGAAANLGQLGLGMRGQDIQAGLGGYGHQLAGLGAIEAQRGQRFGAIAGQPTALEKGLALGIGAGKAFGLGGGKPS